MLYVYLGCLAFGVAYSVLSAILGAHGADHSGIDHGGANGHSGMDHADVPSPFNPLVMASGIATFGTVGLIGKIGFKMGDLTSAVVSLAFAGAVGAAIFFGIVKFMYGSQSNSTFSEEALVGLEAQIITPVPQNGVGEIFCVINGVRCNLPARTVDGSTLTRGETVIIRDISGHTATVSRKITIDNLDLLQFEEDPTKKSKENENA